MFMTTPFNLSGTNKKNKLDYYTYTPSFLRWDPSIMFLFYFKLKKGWGPLKLAENKQKITNSLYASLLATDTAISITVQICVTAFGGSKEMHKIDWHT